MPGGARVQAKPSSWPVSPYVVIAATTLVFWALSSIGLVMYTAGVREATTYELVIPPGTRDEIASGGNPLELHSTWSYYAGDVLVIANRDTVVHRIGPWSVAPGSVFTVELQPELGGSFACSLLPAGEISLDVQPRGYDWRLTLFPTLLLGPALGLIIVGVRRVMRAIDDPDG